MYKFLFALGQLTEMLVRAEEFLITRFWGAEDDTSDNTLSLAMFKLREKLGSEGDAICTIRGVGYAYRP